jgi:hypothetical protein
MRLKPLILLGLFLIAGVFPVFAQEELNPAAGDPPVQAIITGPDDIAAGLTIILDASSSRVSGDRTEYRWSIDETRQFIGNDVQAIFTPDKPGTFTFRLAVKTTGLNGKVLTNEAVHPVVVFTRKILVVADASVNAEKLATHSTEAMKNGVYVKAIQTDPSVSRLSVEDTLVKMLSEDKNALVGADAIVVWTEGIAGLQALMRAVQNDAERMAAIRNQSIILLTENSLGTIARTTHGALTLIKPAQLIVTRSEAILPLINAETVADFRNTLGTRDIGFQVLNASSLSLRPWNVLSILVNYLLSHGVSAQAVILLLILPIIATIFAFLKQIIGITSFGLYTPSIVALSFLALGWQIGLLFLLFILIMGYLTRSAMKRFRLLYIPKVAIILTVLSFTLLLLVAIGASAGVAFPRDTVFILLIMSALAENFLNLKTEEGWRSAFLGIGETVLGSLLCVFIVSSQFLQSLVLAYPELILLTIIVNILLGRWTGLRLVEYFRFREVFKHLQEEE